MQDSGHVNVSAPIINMGMQDLDHFHFSLCHMLMCACRIIAMLYFQSQPKFLTNLWLLPVLFFL
jgi:hypothetical protein